MSVTVGDAVVYYRGDNTDALKKMDETEKKSKGWASRVGSIVKTGLMAGTVAVVGMAAAMGKLAFDAMPIEGIKKAFEGLTKGSTETIKSLRKGSLGMVKDAKLMENYNKAAQLVSKTFADQLPDAMQYLAKVSAATGTDMGYMMDSITTGVGRMSPMILDNLGIQVSLAEANEAWALKMGVATSEMSKQEQQAALMDQVMVKLKENTADMPEVTENAATKWAQLTTKLGNLKDNIGLSLLPMFVKVVDFISDSFIPKIEKWVATISAVSGSFVRFLKEGDIYGAFEYLGAWLEAAWGEFVAPKLVSFGKGFWDFFAGEYGVIKAGLFLIQNRFTPQIVYAISQVWPGIQAALKEWGNKFWDWLTGEGGAIEQATGAMTSLAETLVGVSEDEAIQEQAREAGKSVAHGMIDGIKSIFTGEGGDGTGTFIDLISGLGNSIMGAIRGMWDVIAQFGAEFAVGIMLGIAEWITGKKAKQDLGDSMVDVLKHVLKLPMWALYGKEWAVALWDSFKNALSGFSLTGAIGGAIGNFGDLLGLAAGGRVPGPLGAPQLAVVHGGEDVKTPEQQLISSVEHNYNLNVSSEQQVESIIEEFALMRAMGGA